MAIYTVRRGDTLWNISRQTGVPVDAIIDVNSLEEPDRLVVGQNLLIPESPEMVRPNMETAGFLIQDRPEAVLDIIYEVGYSMTYVPVFDFPVNSQGQITGNVQTRFLTAINSVGAVPLAVISNFDGTNFNRELAHQILSSTGVPESTADNTLAFINRHGFGGVMVDFENMPAGDRNLYTQFIKLLADRLKPYGYVVSLAAAPKYADLPGMPWVGAFDYAALGAIADFLFIMTYEWGWIGGPPNAIAPLPLGRQVLEYALGLMPADRIMMGMPVYGYDWPLPDTPETIATTVTLAQAWRLAADFNAEILWSDYARSPYFNYYNGNAQPHQVWFEDIKSHDEKYRLARELGIRGVGYWQLNSIFTSTIYLLNSMFNVVQI
jgi:spore germination protein